MSHYEFDDGNYDDDAVIDGCDILAIVVAVVVIGYFIWQFFIR